MTQKVCLIMEDRYETGKGLFGGPGGTYGRYSVGSRVTEQGKSLRNLSTQFDSAEDIEDQQRRRFGRRRESGYSGAGSWFLNYPYMLGTLGSGTGSYDTRDQNQPVSDGSDTASSADGMGSGGTAAGFVGGLGS
jgi:hypothetical protein